ncbi:MAG: hypothetical protein AAGF60_11210 [Pseudomonadota bacterium]
MNGNEYEGAMIAADERSLGDRGAELARELDEVRQAPLANMGRLAELVLLGIELLGHVANQVDHLEARLDHLTPYLDEDADEHTGELLAQTPGHIEGL